MPCVYPLRVSHTSRTIRTQENPISNVSKRLRRYGFAVSALAVAASMVTGPAFPSISGKNASQGSTVTCGNSGCAADSPELQMFALLNNDRTAPEQAAETRGHARPLQWDPRLAALARAHSVELANGSFSHMSADGSLPSDRMSKAGIRWLYMGENIAEARDVAQAEAAMMNEPRFQQNHRGNILNPNYSTVGVGIVNGPDGMLYITQEFAQLR
jgi:uncharacterized protein YkwD